MACALASAQWKSKKEKRKIRLWYLILGVFACKQNAFGQFDFLGFVSIFKPCQTFFMVPAPSESVSSGAAT
jgi:hypothetical protein